VCLLYLDDIIVHGRECGEVIKRLRTVLQRLRDKGLKLSPKKCILLQQTVPFLGHVVSDHSVSTDPKKIEAVRTWPSPPTVKDVKSFLGLCSYYRCFVYGFADIDRPLYRLQFSPKIMHALQWEKIYFEQLRPDLDCETNIEWECVQDKYGKNPSIV